MNAPDIILGQVQGILKCETVAPTTISISGQTNRDLCPVLALHIYLTTFNPKMGPFFQFQDGSPVKHSFSSDSHEQTNSDLMKI
jgi:hypothetical protein